MYQNRLLQEHEESYVLGKGLINILYEQLILMKFPARRAFANAQISNAVQKLYLFMSDNPGFILRVEPKITNPIGANLFNYQLNKTIQLQTIMSCNTISSI